MIRSGKSVRFTDSEAQRLREVGLDMNGVTNEDGIEQELSRWAHTLADERPALLEKIARELTKEKGVKLPAKLSAIPSSRFQR